MTDLAKLQIRVQSLEAQVADRRLKGMATSGHRAEKATSGLMATMARFAGPAAIMAGAVSSLTKLVSVTREFDVLNAQLITATGSAKDASEAFAAIEDFAAQTPYDLAQATESFTKLVNLGLTPSERAMRSYGDTSAAMGKDMMQLVEAVADAATGEFERLKEFGIRASKQGDQVSFTFRGMKETVAFNSQEIEEYLIKLGENNFAGAMQERMDSLDGALSNLGDAWDTLWREISDQGAGDLIESGVRAAIDAVTELTDMLRSGELEGYFDAFTMGFRGWVDDAGQSLIILDSLMGDAMGNLETDMSNTAGELVSAFKYFPENVRAFIRILTVDFLTAFDRWGVDLREFADKAKAVFTDDTIEEAAKRAEKERQALFTNRDDMIALIIKERDEEINAKDQQIEATKNLREEYDRLQMARKESTAGEDRLAKYKTGGEGDGGPTEEEKEKARKEAEEFAKGRDKATEFLDQYRSEEEMLDVHHERQIEKLNEFREKEFLTNKEWWAALKDEKERYHKASEDLEKKSWQGQLGTVASGLSEITGMMSSENRKMFEIGKMAAIAQTLVSIPSSAQKAYDAMAGIPIVGPALGAAAAAAAIVAGGARLQAIQSAQFGGGGSAGGSGGGITGGVQTVPAAPAPVQLDGGRGGGGQGLQITFNGPVNGLDEQSLAVTLGDAIKDRIDNTDFVLVESSSRNGRDLRS